MRIDWAITCRYAEVNTNLVTIVGAGIDTYMLAEFPADLQVVLAVRLLAGEDDLGPEKTHTLVIRVLDPEMELISEIPVTMEGLESPNRRPGWEAGLALPIVQLFRVPEPGIYTIDLAIGGGTRTIPIIVLDQQG